MARLRAAFTKRADQFDAVIIDVPDFHHAPNTTGSAALLVQWWDKLFPGHVMRASTLKALLIHTADDLGTPGPDYKYGWGLINVKAAADLVQAYRNSPGTRRVIEDQITTTVTARSYSFTWDGSSPLRATLCWTDPAGALQSVSDSRTAALVNNLDLKINGPTGTLHQPYVMPFVALSYFVGGPFGMSRRYSSCTAKRLLMTSGMRLPDPLSPRRRSPLWPFPVRRVRKQILGNLPIASQAARHHE
ncbi:MAG: S8 family serine peptidase [Verrucomicrobia bacterium]|nr:S8 family serine peptidase [Verrucomicrobiota bacterium]